MVIVTDKEVSNFHKTDSNGVMGTIRRTYKLI